MDRVERRKKIMSHGTDRMALITGRIQSVDPDPDSAPTPPNDHYPTSSSTTNQKQQFFQDHHGEKAAASDQRKPEHKKEVAIRTTTDDSKNFQKKPFSHVLSSITLKEVNTSIISSENTRVICSIVIAVLVVLSHVNVPHKVVKSTSLISYRPLYVVLLTDVLIVFGRLALYAQVAEEEDRENENGNGNNNSWDGAVKLLEVGLVLHQAIRGVFIDCSFYVVIVICGLSLD